MAEVKGVAGDQLRSYVERIERLTEEIKGVTADRKDTFDQAKLHGFDPKIIKIIVRRRTMTQAELYAEDALVATYERVLSEWESTPLGSAGKKLAADIEAGLCDLEAGDDSWMSEQIADAKTRRGKGENGEARP